MKKILYYVVERSTESDGQFDYCTDSKSVTTYDMNSENNRLEVFFNLDLMNEDNTEEAINNYLNDNGYSDESFELIQL